MPKTCAYKDNGSRDMPECSGPVAYRIRNYWLGEARKKFGPDMLLCKAHAKWLGQVNPHHNIEKAR